METRHTHPLLPLAFSHHFTYRLNDPSPMTCLGGYMDQNDVNQGGNQLYGNAQVMQQQQQQQAAYVMQGQVNMANMQMGE